MFFKQALILAVTATCALAQTASNPALQPLATPPAACEADCAILDQLNAVDPSNLATLSAVCTQEAADTFNRCITCFQTNSPSTFTPELIAALQESSDTLTTGCLLVGSPVSSIVIPTPTATGTGSGGGSSTPAPTGGSSGGSSSTPASNTQSSPPASTTGAAVSNSANGFLAVAAAAGAIFML